MRLVCELIINRTDLGGCGSGRRCSDGLRRQPGNLDAGSGCVPLCHQCRAPVPVLQAPPSAVPARPLPSLCRLRWRCPPLRRLRHRCRFPRRFRCRRLPHPSRARRSRRWRLSPTSWPVRPGRPKPCDSLPRLRSWCCNSQASPTRPTPSTVPRPCWSGPAIPGIGCWTWRRWTAAYAPPGTRRSVSISATTTARRTCCASSR